jgi:TRAP-type C4-dicarboxylate transport system substrate-binding protein
MNRRAVLLASVASAMITVPAFAQDIPETRLRMADSFPLAHVISGSGAQFFVEQVKTLSGGKITIDYFPAEQMGKAADLLSLTQSRVVDIGYVAPAYVSEKMPLSDVANLPGMFSDVCVGSKAFIKLATEGELAKREFEGNGVKLLFASTMPPYQVSGPYIEIKSLDDLKGRKIRTSGAATDLMVRELGGVPTRLSGAETYEGLERRTIDFNLGPYSSYAGYGLYPMTKFGTKGFSFGSFIATYSINLDVWNGLSAPVQDVLTKAAEATDGHLCEAIEAENAKAISDMEALGSKFLAESDETKAQFAPVAESLHAAWAKAMDDRGLPGTEVLASFKKALGGN